METDPSELQPLLPRVASGDPAAVADVVDRYSGVVRAIARRALPAEADDLTQDIFIQIWRSAGSFDPDLGTELTFVVTLARRKVIDRLRALGRRPRFDPLPENTDSIGPTPPHQDPSRSSELADELERAREAMGQLRDEERQVLEMTLVDGLSQSEVAERTRLPLGTVKTHARRGLIRLRSLLVSVRAGREVSGSTREVNR